MRAVSAGFLASLRSSHLVATLAELSFPTGTEPGSYRYQIPVSDGQVTLDRTAPVRRSGQVTIPWSLDAYSRFGIDIRTLPFGCYCRLYRGLRYPNGQTELVRLGSFRVESVAWTSESVATLELADSMAQVRDEVFLRPYAPKTTTPVNRAGTLIDDKATVTGLSQTSDLVVDMAVTGLGIYPGTRIVSIDSASQVTLSAPANIYGLKNATLVAGSRVVTEISDTADLFAGMSVSGTGVPPGTTITSVDRVEWLNGQITISQPATQSSGVTQPVLTFTAPSVQTLTFGGAVRLGQAAAGVVNGVGWYWHRLPAIRINYDPAYVLIDTAYSGSRADALADLAQAAGAQAYFDADGNFVFEQPPDPAAPVVWRVDAGDTGVLVKSEEALDRTGLYNGVFVEGQADAAGLPITSLVVDSTPNSPTYWSYIGSGGFGRVARIEKTSAVRTQAQADAAAQALLDQSLGLARSITLTAAPNPALEPGDKIEVAFPDGRVEQHIVDAISIGLHASSGQSLQTRSRWAPASPNWAPLPQAGRTVYRGAGAWQALQGARVVEPV